MALILTNLTQDYNQILIKGAHSVKTELTNLDNYGVLFSTASFVNDAEAFVNGIRHVKHSIFTNLGFFAAGDALITIYRAIVACSELSGEAPNVKAETILGFLSDFGGVGVSLQSFVDALENVGLVGSPIKWVPPLMMVGAVLQTVGVFMEIKRLAEAYREQNQVEDAIAAVGNDNFAKGGPIRTDYYYDTVIAPNQYMDNSVAKYRQIIGTFLKNNSVNHDLHHDVPLLSHRLMVIESQARQNIESATAMKRAQGRSSLEATILALKGKIAIKKWSHALTSLAMAVSLIGIAIILFSPISWLGCGFCALGSLITIFLFFYKNRMQKLFDKAIGLNSTPG